MNLKGRETPRTLNLKGLGSTTNLQELGVMTELYFFALSQALPKKMDLTLKTYAISSSHGSERAIWLVGKESLISASLIFELSTGYDEVLLP
jgi:hypothetical protein